MLGDALSYPRRGDDWLKTVGIGGVLTLGGAFLFVPLLPALGYFVRVLRPASDGERGAPGFDGWGDLFVDGVQVLVIQAVYLVAPGVVVFVGLAVAGFGAFSGLGGSTAGAVVEAAGVVLALVGVVALFLGVYVVPAGLTGFAREGRMRAAFAPGRIRRAAFTGDYLVAFVLAVVVGSALVFVGLLLSFVLVGIFVTFYAQVVTYYLLGRGYAAGLGLDASDGMSTA